MKIEEYFNIDYHEVITVTIDNKVTINGDYTLSKEEARKLAEFILNNTK